MNKSKHWEYNLEAKCWVYKSFGDIPGIEQQLEEDLADVEDDTPDWEAPYDAFEEEKYREILEDLAEREYAAHIRETDAHNKANGIVMSWEEFEKDQSCDCFGVRYKKPQ